MHQLIYGLVQSGSGDGALEDAKNRVFPMVVDAGDFDYFVTFDVDGRGVAGEDRWGDLPVAAPVEEERGQELVDRGWDATVSEYERSFDRIQEFLNDHDVEDFWNNRNVHREYSLDFHKVGEYHGSSTFLYDEYGQGIRHRDTLDQLLEESKTGEEEELYVVPADVHY